MGRVDIGIPGERADVVVSGRRESVEVAGERVGLSLSVARAAVEVPGKRVGISIGMLTDVEDSVPPGDDHDPHLEG